MSLLCVGGSLCVIICFKSVLCFWHVSASFAFYLRVFSVSGVPVGVCIGGNFSLQIKTQLVQLSLNSVEEVFFCVCMCCSMCECVCVYAHGKEQSKELYGGEIVQKE